MEKYLPALQGCALFQNIASSDIPGLLACLGASLRTYKKQQQILSEGDPADRIGILLTGSAAIVSQDIYGNRSILALVQPGQLFAESFACSGVEVLPISVVAGEDAAVLLIDSRRITQSCSNACGFHNQMIYNLLQAVAARSLEFHQKLEIIAQRTTREKLMAFLLSQAKAAGSKEFTIPYDRQELADYLGVERSAMSAELSKLQKEGVLTTNRSHFTLL
jgi:CRP-like cAMP-binding protein